MLKHFKSSLIIWSFASLILAGYTIIFSRLFLSPWSCWKLIVSILIIYNLLGFCLSFFSFGLDRLISVIKPSAGKDFRPSMFGAVHCGAVLFLSLFFHLNKVIQAEIYIFSTQGYLANASLALGSALMGALAVSLAVKLLSPRQFKWGLAAAGAVIILGLYSMYFISIGFTYKDKPGPESVPNDTGLKVFLLGIDGATWDVLDGLIAEGKTPNFARLVQEGFSDRLTTIIPTSSPIIWTTIATGKTPRKHGIMDRTYPLIPGLGGMVINLPQLLGANLISSALMSKGVFKTVPVSNSIRQTKAVWNINTDYGLTTYVLGWWGTWPPDSIKGAMVSDLASARKQQIRIGKKQLSLNDKSGYIQQARTFPSQLEEELEPINQATILMSLEEANYFFTTDSSLLEKINEVKRWDSRDYTTAVKFGYLADKYYLLSAKHLMENQDWDCIMLYLNEVDILEHFFWRYYDQDAGFPKIFGDFPFQDVVPRTYMVIDRMLGEILELIDDSTIVLIVSDHGFQTYYTRYGNFAGHTKAPDGILIAHGPGIVPRLQRTGEFSVFDITPTMLTLLGIPLGKDMDGKVMEKIFEDDFLQNNPVTFVNSHDRGFIFRRKNVTPSDVDEHLLDKMRALGYIK